MAVKSLSGSRLQYGQVVADIALRAPMPYKGNEAGFALVEHGRDAVVVAALLVGARFSLALGLGVFDKFHNHDIAYALGAAISKRVSSWLAARRRAGIVQAISLPACIPAAGLQAAARTPACDANRPRRPCRYQDRSTKCNAKNPVIHFPLLIVFG